MRHRSPRKMMSEINVVPYIDVMLVLLVIFMITAPLLSQGVRVELPQAASKPLEQQSKEPVIVSVDQQGNFFSNYPEAEQDQPKDPERLINLLAALKRTNPEIPVYVKGDRNVPYGRVVELMTLLQRAGFDGVGLVTEPVEDTPAP